MTDEADTPGTPGISEDGKATGVAERGEAGDGAEQLTPEGKLERQVREKDERIRRLQSEKDKALSEGSKLNQLLEQLVKAQTGKADGGADTGREATEAARVDALVTEIADAWREDETKGTRKTLEVVSSYLRDVEARAKEELGLTKKELQEHMATEMAKVHDLLADRDPDYVQNADSVKALAEELGLDAKKDRALLTKLAKREAKPDRPERHDLPGGGGGRNGRASEGDAISAGEEATLTAGMPGGEKLTKAERDFLSRKQ